jgi:hypothetical protein
MFVNLKIDKVNEILVVHKLLNTNQLKAKQTYIGRSSFNAPRTCGWMNPSMKGHRLYVVEPYERR